MLFSGKIYEFKVVESERNHSIVEYEGKTYYYPSQLKELDTVELKVKSVAGDKVFFDLDPFFKSDEKIFKVKFLEKIDNQNPAFGIIKVEYNSHILEVKVPGWMIDNEFKFDEILSVRKSKYGPKIFIENFEHYKFQINEKYEFEIIDENESWERYWGQEDKEYQLIVLDPETNTQYRAKKHFSKNFIKPGSKQLFRYIGVDSNYNVRLVDSESKMKANLIFKDEEIEAIKFDYLVNSDLRKKLIEQIDDEDNFWLMTAVKYLYEVSLELFNRFKYNDALKLNNLNMKLCGFMVNKKFFSSLPNSLKERSNRVFNLIKGFTEELDIILNYITHNDYEDLFQEEENINNDLKVLFLTLKYSKFKLISEDQFYEYVLKISDNKIGINTSYLDHIFQYYNTLLDNIIQQYSNQIFINPTKKSVYIKTLNLNLHIYTIEKIIELSENPFTTIHLKFIKRYLKYLNEEKFNLFDSTLKDMLRVYGNRENKFLIDTEGIKCKDLFIYEKNFAIISNEEAILIIKKSNINHLLNFYISQNYDYEISVEENIKDTILFGDVKFSKSLLSEQKPESVEIGDDLIVVVKSIDLKNNRAFATYHYDAEKDLCIEGLMIGEFIVSLEIGQSINAKVIDITENKPLFIVDDNIYNFKEFNTPLKGEIIKKTSVNKNKCPYCESTNIEIIGKKQTELICLDNACKAKIFLGAEIFFPEINKKIYFNKSSIFGVNGFDFFENLAIGDNYNFIVDSSKTQELRYVYNDEKKKISKTIYNIQPSSLLIKGFNHKIYYKIHINRLLFFTFLILDTVLEASKDSRSKNKYLNLSRILGAALRHPKVYVLNIKKSIYDIIEDLKKDIDIKEKVAVLKTEIKSKYLKTFEIFPNLKKLNLIVSCLEFYDSNDFEKQFENLKNESEIIKKLVKLILIKNLVQEDDKKSTIIKQMKNKIVGLLEKGITDVYDIELYKEENEEPENIRILKQIEAGEIIENINYEFKETLKVPVLTNEDHKNIEKIKSNLNLSTEKKNTSVHQIIDSKNISNKNQQYLVSYSTFKNICALLNSNSGKIIVGVRDNNELIGLYQDYKLVNDFDGFQLYFDAMWDRLFCQPEKYRPYVNIERVLYNEKEFCFINVETPNDFDDPCFIYDHSKDKQNPMEKCYIKANASTKSLRPTEIAKFKRARSKVTVEPNYVYIKIDSNNLYKIGHSKDPDARRGTLMSQDPGIKTIFTSKFPSKDIAFKIEKHLHNEFKEFKTRGEWFDLENDEIEKIKKILNHQKEVFLPESQNEFKF